MLLRSMPDVSPGNTQFRSWFYSRWGREHCIILARTRNAQYESFRQRLSIKMAFGGQERYFIDGRSVAVDDDSYLVLNDDRRYGSSIESTAEVESFSIFFRPGFMEEMLGAASTPLEHVCDLPIRSPVTDACISDDGQRLAVMTVTGPNLFQIDGKLENAANVEPAHVTYFDPGDMNMEGVCFVPEGLLASTEQGQMLLFQNSYFDKASAGK